MPAEHLASNGSQVGSVVVAVGHLRTGAATRHTGGSRYPCFFLFLFFFDVGFYSTSVFETIRALAQYAKSNARPPDSQQHPVAEVSVCTVVPIPMVRISSSVRS